MSAVRVAILGANGHVGSVLFRRLAGSRGVTPVGICRNTIGAAVVSNVPAETRVGSVADPEAAPRLLAGCGVVVHTIWPGGDPDSVEEQTRCIIDNLSTIDSLRRIIILSSVAVYGSCIDARRSTFEDPRSDTLYGVQKIAADRYAQRVFAGKSTELFILRLGHVFGADQWVSREVMTLSSNEHYALAFDGARSANAIHVEEAADGLEWIVNAPIAPGTYNFCPFPQWSWRRIYDWHTEVCGLRRVGGLDAEASAGLRRHFISEGRRPVVAKAVRDMAAWARQVPYSSMLSPEIKRAVRPVLGLLPEAMKRRLIATSGIWTVRSQIRALQIGSADQYPWYCSDEMPGPYLPWPSRWAEHESPCAAELQAWYRSTMEPPRFASPAIAVLTQRASRDPE